MINNGNKILCVSVHPDDETFGCGGTLLKHRANGDSISCLWVTQGNEQQLKIIPKLKEAYAFSESFCLNLPDGKLDEVPFGEIVMAVAKVFNYLQPNIIYIPNRSDAHSDHRVVYNAVAACSKPFRFPFIREVLMMEVMSETDTIPTLHETAFLPNVFSDITDYFKTKLEIMSFFESEILPFPQTRNANALQAQARSRGYPINAEFAEAFMLVRSIRK